MGFVNIAAPAVALTGTATGDDLMQGGDRRYHGEGDFGDWRAAREMVRSTLPAS